MTRFYSFCHTGSTTFYNPDLAGPLTPLTANQPLQAVVKFVPRLRHLQVPHSILGSERSSNYNDTGKSITVFMNLHTPDLNSTVEHPVTATDETRTDISAPPVYSTPLSSAASHAQAKAVIDDARSTFERKHPELLVFSDIIALLLLIKNH